MTDFISLLLTVKHAIWSTPLLILLLGTGIYLTFLLKGVQFRYLLKSFTLFFKKGPEKAGGEGDISPFQSLMTSMSSAVGTGSIVGVATALAVGGVGAVFWLWVATFICMIVKYAENVLAVAFRKKEANGQFSGGPMHYIEKGFRSKKIAYAYALIGTFCAITTGNLVQVNAISEATQFVFGVDPLITGVVLALFIGYVLIGGIKRQGALSAILVPFKAIFYTLICLVVILLNASELFNAFSLIFTTAFEGQAATGGFLGASVSIAIQMGVSRSVFCSEAGLGISSIASGASKTESSGKQAMMSMCLTLVATAFICTLTALVILVTGSFGSDLQGATLIIEAFNQSLYGGKYLVTLCLVLFASTAVISWAYYGQKCYEFLFGSKRASLYTILFVASIIPGCLIQLDIVWLLADIANGLLVLPNVIALIALAPVIKQETDQFLLQEKQDTYV